MKVKVLHEGRGRIRFHIPQAHMTYKQADTLTYFLSGLPGVTRVKVCDKTCNAVVEFQGTKENILMAMEHFEYTKVQVPAIVFAESDRAEKNRRQEEVVKKIAAECVMGLLPKPVQLAFAAYGYYQKIAQA